MRVLIESERKEKKKQSRVEVAGRSFEKKLLSLSFSL